MPLPPSDHIVWMPFRIFTFLGALAVLQYLFAQHLDSTEYKTLAGMSIVMVGGELANLKLRKRDG